MKRLIGLIAWSLWVAACQAFNQPDLPTNRLPIADVVVHESWSDHVHPAPRWVTAQSPGMGFGLFDPCCLDAHPSQRPQMKERHLAAGEAWEALLSLSASPPTTALVTVLLDYQQIEFELDGQMGLLHEIPVGDDLAIPLRVAGLAPGWHDLIIIVFADPYNASLDIEERMSAVTGMMMGGRMVLLVGDSEVKPTLPAPWHGTAIPVGTSLGFRVAFAEGVRSHRHPSERQVYVTQGTAGQRLPFQVWASNLHVHTGRNGRTDADHAILLFQDYHLVPINGQQPLLVHLDAREEFVLDTAVTLPAQTGVSEWQLVRIADPYRSILDDEVHTTYVERSFRLGVAVLPPPDPE